MSRSSHFASLSTPLNATAQLRTSAALMLLIARLGAGHPSRSGNEGVLSRTLLEFDELPPLLRRRILSAAEHGGADVTEEQGNADQTGSPWRSSLSSPAHT